jgi:exopolysaccharide biosynthesis WecB/TagA/CpsF family protein
MSSGATINIDYTHVGRRASGIERATVEQFNDAALSPLAIRTYGGSGKRVGVALAQMVGLPLQATRNTSDIYVFPGFPPSPYFVLQRDRSVLFVHDLFLLTRRNDLNRSGKYYMAPLFSLAVRKFRYFMTNSEDTTKKLRAFCDPAATIVLYRPHIRNVFGLDTGDRAERSNEPVKLRIVAIGTIEPRKNFPAAAKICELLSRLLRREVELHIIGRIGWGDDIRALRGQRNVVLHGYLDDAEARPIIEAADLLLCTSHEEGLCLPLIEAQYGGMPVVAPDEGVFREVLGESGILLNSRSAESAAQQIADAITVGGWRRRFVDASTANVTRWNSAAENDRKAVISFLSELASVPRSISRGGASERGPFVPRRDPDVPAPLPPLVEVGGQFINVSDLNHAIEAVIARLTNPKSFLVCTLNLDHLVKLRRSPELREAYKRAEIVTADGFPIVALARRQGCRLQRAAGSDLIEPLCAAAAQRGFSIFLMGSTFPVLSESARRLIASCPGLKIAGVYAPPSNFDIRSEAADQAIALLQGSGARLCFIALGAPLQEAFAMRALAETSGVGLLAIGAGLEYVAGAQVRCPRILQKMNLEWAWRLMNDPRRLWLRYAQCALLFGGLLLSELPYVGRRRITGWDRV